MTESNQTKTDNQDELVVLPILVTVFGMWAAAFPIFLPDWGMFPVNPLHWFFVVSALTAAAAFVVLRLAGSPSGTTRKEEA